SPPNNENWEAYTALGIASHGLSVIAGNTFTNLESDYRGPLLHAVYLSHNSSYNEIRDNIFEIVSGDAIRVRDNSNFNAIYRNKENRAGIAEYSESFCQHVVDPCLKQNYEYTAYGNEFYDNELGVAYERNNLKAEICLDKGDF